MSLCLHISSRKNALLCKCVHPSSFRSPYLRRASSSISDIKTILLPASYRPYRAFRLGCAALRRFASWSLYFLPIYGLRIPTPITQSYRQHEGNHHFLIMYHKNVPIQQYLQYIKKKNRMAIRNIIKFPLIMCEHGKYGLDLRIPMYQSVCQINRISYSFSESCVSN